MAATPGKIPLGHPEKAERGREGEKKSINCRGGVGPDHAISRGGFFKAKISIDSVV